MTGRPRTSPRGRPLATLVLLLAAWIGGRVALWESPFAETGALAIAVAPKFAGQDVGSRAIGAIGGATMQDRSMGDSPATGPYPGPTQSIISDYAESPEPVTWDGNPTATLPSPLPPREPKVAASHQLMWLAALAHLPTPEALNQRVVTPTGPVEPRAAPGPAARRWSLDAWSMWRQGSGASLASQGRVPTYGASQAGAALAYRLAPSSARDPRAYLRLYHALVEQGEGELAMGLSARPLPALPIRAYAELRATRFGDESTHLRPAVLAVTELAPQKLPARLRGELYLQGGYVGGKGATGFADGQLHVLRDVGQFDLARVSLGGGVWGGIQQGSRRLDLGPTLRADLTLGKTPARVSVDWRERVAGNADPDSGLAVTLSTRF